MVHMRCQHLHSEVVHTQRLWRAFLSTCQTRPVSSLATRSSKGKFTLTPQKYLFFKKKTKYIDI